MASSHSETEVRFNARFLPLAGVEPMVCVISSNGFHDSSFSGASESIMNKLKSF